MGDLIKLRGAADTKFKQRRNMHAEEKGGGARRRDLSENKFAR